VPNDYVFRGFSDPTYTQVPDEVFDELAPRLTESELRVLLYILRRTFGFKKRSDAISISQMVNGITTRDGRVLDLGTGMSRPGVTKGIKGLIAKGVIEAERTVAEDGVNQVNVYRLRFASSAEGVGNEVNYGGKPRFQGVGNDVDPQQTEQQTVGQHRSNGTKPRRMVSRQDRTTIEAMITDYAREFRDQAPLASSVGRALNLYADSGLDLDRFLATMQEARAATQRASGGIRAESADGSGRKAKMAYFFSVLEDLLQRAA
jgi:hypothetical protein